MTEKGYKKYNSWPAVIPKVDQVVQIQLGKGKGVYEVKVLNRWTFDGNTFFIQVSWYCNVHGLILKITPTADRRDIEARMGEVFPSWVIELNSPQGGTIDCKLFFLDD